MTPLRVRPRFPSQARRHAQRGVIMILTLIALVLLLIGVAAMVRSTDSATAVIGNLAFRRDLNNRAELGIATARTALNSGPLNSLSARNSDLPTSNYSGVRLTNATGIGVPAVLLSNTAYSNAGYQCLPASCNPGTDGVVIRWVIDRQCYGSPGVSLVFATDSCAYIEAPKDSGGSAQSNPSKASPADRGLYRISVRVSGPRNTESYIQATEG